MDEDEGPEEGRILYATPTLMNGVMALDTTKSREILNAFNVKKKVPQSRFYTAIHLLKGKDDEAAGHYERAKAAYVQTEDTAVDASKTYYTKSGSIYTDLSGYYEQVSADGKDINFMIIHKPAIIKFDKHIASDVIPARLNANADGDILKYRKYGLVDYYKNKAAGFYVSHKA